MTATVDPAAELRDRMTGALLAPSDPGYDPARRVWNGGIDRRPALIARCSGAADVVAAVGYARRHGLEISVRGGAHNTAGLAVGDGGLVVDLSAMNRVEVDPVARRVRVGGGALLRDMDAATQEHGLAVPAGEVGHTGIGGLALGGGMGWLTRQHGLTADNLVAAEVVLADGRVVRAAADENPDLYWALRGGGGNFGVVTAFEFDAFPVGPMISFGMFFFGLDQGPEVLRLARETIPALPASVSFQIVAVNAPPAPFVPEQVQLQPGWALLVIGTGADADAAAVHDLLRAGPAPLFEFCTPMPYVALQQMFDEANAWGMHCYEKGCYLAELTDPVIDVVAEHAARKTSPMSTVHFYVLDGGYCAPADDATAFGGARTPRLGVFLVGLTGGTETLPAETAWVRAFYRALLPHVIIGGGYVNSMVADDAGRVRESYGEKYDRLARIKAELDPDNVFHRNSNIVPAGSP